MKSRKTLVWSLLLILCLCSGITAATSYPDYVRGDSNGDGNVTILDALLAAQYYVGVIEHIDLWAADVNCDGKINIVDALLIAQYYVGVLRTFPCPGAPGGSNYVPGDVIIGFNDDVTLAEADLFIAAYNLVWTNHFPTSFGVWVALAADDSTDYISLLEDSPLVSWAKFRGYSNQEAGKKYILIQTVNGVSEEQIDQLLIFISGMTKVETLWSAKWGVVDVPVGDELKWIGIFTRQPIVKYAELNGIVTIDLL